MTICPKCEMPIAEGEHVRIQMLGVFHHAAAPLHAIDPYEEEWVEHLSCDQSGAGD